MKIDLPYPRPACCTPRSLAPHQHIEAFVHAVAHNPVNLPIAPLNPDGTVPHPEYIALLRKHYWQPGQRLRVVFLEGDEATNTRVLNYANRWQTPGIPVPLFVGVPRGSDSDIRVSYSRPGYWSYIGTDARMVSPSECTLNLQGFDGGSLPDSEWLRVIPHEFGHALGCVHEQQRPEVIARLDRAAIIAEFERTQGWSEQEIIQQVLAPLDMSTVDATAEDDASIMMYWLASRLTLDHREIPGGSDITPRDRQGMAKAYGGSVGPTDPPSNPALPLLIGGPRVSGPTPFRLLVESLKDQRLTLFVDVTNKGAGGHQPKVTIASEGPGELTPIPLDFWHLGGQGLPWRRTDSWHPGRYVVIVAHPNGVVGAKAYARLSPAVAGE
jgi:hypothetical protein